MKNVDSEIQRVTKKSEISQKSDFGGQNVEAEIQSPTQKYVFFEKMQIPKFRGLLKNMRFHKLLTSAEKCRGRNPEFYSKI